MVPKQTILEKIDAVSTTTDGSEPPSAPSTPLSEITASARSQLQACKDAGKEIGSFDIRATALGNLWSTQILKNMKLRNDYQVLEKGPGLRQKQQEFRTVWAKGLWQVIERSRTHEKIAEDKKGKFSEFVPIPKWLDKEGGGRGAVEGLKHLIKKAKQKKKHTTKIKKE